MSTMDAPSRVRREVPAWFVLVEQEASFTRTLSKSFQSRLPQWVPLLDDHRRHHQVRAPPPQFNRDRRAVNLNCIRVANVAVDTAAFQSCNPHPRRI